MRKLRSVELPMKENVSGYSRNPCSLNRERDTAFAAKLLTLPTGFFSETFFLQNRCLGSTATAYTHLPFHWAMRDSPTSKT